MTELGKILKNDIERTIDGVIKADDEVNIIREVEEYVVTREINRHLGRLVEGYLDSVEKVKRGSSSPYNGVWISGYFGSGKSHLLKMLAYLFEDRQQGGKKVSDIFISKIEDQFLKANIKKMLEAKSRSILFNIDQLADAAQASDDNAMLFIFEKVLNRMAGYFPESRNIAEFERHLDEEGKYEKFMDDYLAVTGKSWAESRSKSFNMGRNTLLQVLCKSLGITEEDAKALADSYRQPVSLSVESFANRVKSYLDSREERNFRLNFFIDEVGQFVAGKTRLMLNLQTIAETLATVCSGRAWIFVTSQEDLQAVVGDPSARQVQDYSKIHARFYYRISLSSTDVQEVIQKRLLAKTEEGAELLSSFYMKERETIRTLYRFDHGGKDIHFRDMDQFLLSYPFQAYQYNLLQQSLRGLSEHNAFMGRHVSRGERSMLEIFQDVARSLKDEKLFVFATFDRMFNGIRETLNTGLLSAVNVAERNIQNPLAVKILKILLLVKYVRDFKATAEHIKVLLTGSLDMDLTSLQTDIMEALNLLEHQTYIQRNGLVYEYLTNEEKDIEEEIKGTPVESDDIRKLVSSIVFEGIVKSAKIRFEDNGEDYPYRKMVDGENVAQSPGSDLAIHIVTPFHPNFDERVILLNQSMGKNEMIVYIEGREFFYRDMKLYFQTDIYCRQSHVADSLSRIGRIITERQHQNTDRRKAIIDRLKELIGKADIYVMGELMRQGAEDPRARIEAGFQSLVRKAYPKLQMIKHHYVESSLRKIIYPDDASSLYSGGASEMDEAQKELSSYIQRKHAARENLSLKALFDDFGTKQYGWYFWAISCVLAKLFMGDYIEFYHGNRKKERDDVYTLLSVRKDHEQVRVIPAPVITQEKFESFRKFYSELFHKPLASSRARDAAADFRNGIREKTECIENWQKNDAVCMPFLSELSPLVERWKELSAMDEGSLIENTSSFSDQMLRDVIDDIDPLFSFMNTSGTQAGKWREICLWFETGRENLEELGFGEDVSRLKELLSSVPYRNNTLRNAIKLYERLKEEESKAISGYAGKGKEQIREIIVSLEGMKEYKELPQDSRTQVCEPLEKLTASIEGMKRISDIRHASEIKARKVLEDIKTEIHSIINPEKKVKYATEREKKVPFSQAELVTEDDVRCYADNLKSHYISLVRDGKRVGL